MPVQQTSQRWVVNPDGSKTRREILEDKEAADEGYSPPRTHAEADAQAEALGVEFPEDVSTVKEKAAFLADQ